MPIFQPLQSRRRFLEYALTIAGLVGLAGRARAQARLEPTPACDDGDAPTPRQTEGPFYSPNSPRRATLIEPGSGGDRMVLEGRVVTRSCRPVPGALVDLWQADDAGVYDNAGFKLRGHQFTDADGRWRFETILPGRYPGRTRHFHVKVQAADRPVLTTQLYIPSDPGNRRDGLFDQRLVIDLDDGRGHFDFVLDLA